MPKVRHHAVKFNTAPTKDNQIYINLIFRYSGNRLKYSTGIKLDAKFWDSKKSLPTIRYPLYSEVKDQLGELEKATLAIHKENPVISLKDFRLQLDYATGKQTRPEDEKKDIPTFIEFMDIFIEERKNKPNSKRGTWKIFRTASNHLKKYATENGTPLDYDDITTEFRHDFEAWLYKEPRKHSTNYAAKMIQILVQFLHEATQRKYNTNTTFTNKGWSIKKEKVQHITLSFDELQKLYDLDLTKNNRLGRVRDLFLIGCYTGLRFSDFTRIVPENVFIEDGGEYIQIITKKTNTEVVIPVLPILKTILEKYDYYSPDPISNQKMNIYLKEVCQMAGLNENVLIQKNKAGKMYDLTIEKHELVSTHTARRSFATNFYELGFTSFELMQITGHATEKQFMAYINISKKRNAKNMVSRMARLMNTSPLKVAK